MTLRVASVAWKLRSIRGDGGYFGHFYDLVSAAHDEAAKLVVFPELHQLELLPLARDLDTEDAAKYLVQFGTAIEEWIQRISTSSDLIIVGGSHFKQTNEGIKNVCAIGFPGEEVIFVEKNVLTPFEASTWDIQAGKGLAKLPSNLGVTVCYDAEFPEAGRALANSGTLVQCVPSWTDTQRGFQRVRWSCLARAIENQNFVIHSSLVGDIGREPALQTYGSAAIIAPSIDPFPVQAILRETPFHEEGVIVADLDFEMLQTARENGEATNWKDRDRSRWEMVEPRSVTYPKPSAQSDEEAS